MVRYRSKRSKSLTAPLISLLTTSTFALGLGIPSTAASEAEPYTIGIIASLTGAASEYGDVLSKASVMAIEEINAEGGVDGRPIRYILEDGQCTAQGAIRAYNKLVQVDKVKVILGPSCSSEALALAPLTKRDKVLAISSGANTDELTGASPYMFRNSAPNRYAVEALAPFVRERYQQVTMLTAVNAYTEGLRDGFVKRYTALGGEIKKDEHYDLKTIDYRTLITKALDNNPPALVLSTMGEFDSGNLLKQLHEAGYEGHVFGYDSLVITKTRRIAGESAQGVLAAVAPYVRPENVKGQKVLAKFKERHGYISYEFYLASAYDSPYILARCLKEIGQIDTGKLKNCLHGIRSYKGAAGTYGFDEHGDPVGISYYIVKLEGDELVVLE